jgi:hypothetical protein
MWRAIDLSLRFVYVALVPVLLPFINLFMPITGMLIGTGIATAIALIGSDRWRARVEGIRFVGKTLGGMAQLADFYREHPAKALLFYVLYPVLLPVLLFFRVPRREFLLYRKLNAIALVVIFATGAWDYFQHWRPELSFPRFLGATIAIMIFQLIVTVMLIMPIVTTLITLRNGSHIRTLSALVTFMLATSAYGTYKARGAHAMSIMTAVRLEERTKVARAELGKCLHEHTDEPRECFVKDRELKALADALDAFALQAKQDPTDDAAANRAAHDKLVEYYKPDEADAFRFAFADGTLVIFAKYGRKPAIWLGLSKGHFVFAAKKLPDSLRHLLGV